MARVVGSAPTRDCAGPRRQIPFVAMTSRVRKVLAEALALSPEERADLAAELLAKLPPTQADELHPDWIAEIERRARQAHDNPESGDPWEEVEQQLVARAAR